MTGSLLAGLVAFSPAEESFTVRRLLGFDNDRLAAAPVPHGSGTHEFMQTQLGSDKPVAYDSCRPIEVTVNPQGAPDDYDELVNTGLRNVEAATGLKFNRVGITDDRDFGLDGAARRKPVLIAWATSDEVPELAGRIAGIGGSVAVGPPGRLRYVTGIVVLDRDVFAGFDRDESADAQGIVDHELGHLVGLGHVDDPGELMYEDNLGRNTFGPGDLEGLARLGPLGC